MGSIPVVLVIFTTSSIFRKVSKNTTLRYFRFDKYKRARSANETKSMPVKFRKNSTATRFLYVSKTPKRTRIKTIKDPQYTIFFKSSPLNLFSVNFSKFFVKKSFLGYIFGNLKLKLTGPVTGLEDLKDIFFIYTTLQNYNMDLRVRCKGNNFHKSLLLGTKSYSLFGKRLNSLPNFINSTRLYSYKYINITSIVFLNKLLSLYRHKDKFFSLHPVSQKYFSSASSFSPSLDNILKFKKIVFYNPFKIQGTSSVITLPTPILSDNIFKKSFILTNFFLKKTICNNFLMKFTFRHLRYKLYFRFLIRRTMRFFKRHVFTKFRRLSYLKKKCLRRYKRLNKRKNLRSTRQLKRLFSNKIKLKVFNFIYLGGVANGANNFFKRLVGQTFMPMKLEYKKSKTYINLSNNSFLKFPAYTRKLLFMLFIFKTSFFLKGYFLFNALGNSFRIDPYYVFNVKPLALFQYHGLRMNNSNIIPNKFFKLKLSKLLVSSRVNFFLKDNVTPWIYNNVIRFIEFCSARKVLIQIYSFMNQSVDINFIILYKRWIPRLSYYERRLGHRFFLEEALHIIHIGFTLKDIKIVNMWLKAIIKRISFWKTRFIFRFLKYLFNNYFIFILRFLGVKGFKVKLKGKISVAGNSRKRSILFRLGKTSHATSNLKVIHHISLVNTFTGVMGLQTWLFY